ncbi:MAG: N-glycosylase/DNA lyase [Candidatus Omnitrophota bacterium]
MKDIISQYKHKRAEIRKRLKEFKGIYKKSDRHIFSELCFCILTPQAKAISCDRAIKRLEKNCVLLKGSKEEIRPYLEGVRFPNNKAGYLAEARKIFKNYKGIKIKDKIDTKDILKTRDWLANNIKGFGYKEASHFLRNIGFGKDLAILDRHILKNLKKYGIIKRIPGSLSKKEYLYIEEKMKGFFKKLNISLEEIDLLFWSKETGVIFK